MALNNFARVLQLSHQSLKGVLINRSSTNFRFLPPFNPETRTKAEFEVIKNPETWKYVERALPHTMIPTPKPKEVYYSDWRPPTADPNKYPYFVPRNKNMMIPVYLIIRKRGTQRITRIRHIKGDIWTMEKELRDYLMEKTGKGVGVRIDELCGNISLRGDWVYYVENWLKEKGF